MISIKTKEEIKKISEGGKILAKIIEGLKKKVEPEITTQQLDRAAEVLIFKFGGKPSFKGYQDFPSTLCTSVNQELVHVPPSNRALKEGDILSLDLGILYKGFHTDMAVTVPVGEISIEAKRLIKVTKKALKRGIKKSKPGNTFGDIGNTIQRYIEGRDFGVVRELCGHGIGRELHQDPKIPNFGKRREGEKLKEGMVFCLEPMVTVGNFNLKRTEDGFGYETKDGSLSCHFEHTVLVTKKGPKILTKIEN